MGGAWPPCFCRLCYTEHPLEKGWAQDQSIQGENICILQIPSSTEGFPIVSCIFVCDNLRTVIPALIKTCPKCHVFVNVRKSVCDCIKFQAEGDKLLS